MKNIKKLFIKLTGKYIYKIVSILFIIILSLSILLIIKANNMAYINPNRIAAINEVITQTTTANLWFEEIIAGDFNKKIENVFKYLKNSQKVLEDLSVQNGNKNIKALKDKNNLELVSLISKQLKKFYLITKARYENIDLSYAGSDIDQEYDNLFTNMIFNLETLKNKISLQSKYEKENFSTIQYIIIFFELIAFILVSFAIYIYIRNKEKLIEKDKIILEQSKLASMGEMIGNIAHQWRQPLSVISSGATGIILQKEIDNINDEDLIKTCNTINNNAQYLSHTIDDFKNFIKKERHHKKFNLKKNIERFLSLVNSSLNKHNINIVINIDDTIELNGYPNELIQCYMNIFNNAKDALKSASLDKKYFFIKCYKKNDSIVLIFKDNANGISEDILPRVFEPYFTTKHQSQGTGLGLHMTYNLITDGMKGEITARNIKFSYNGDSYYGAEFTIILPQNII